MMKSVIKYFIFIVIFNVFIAATELTTSTQQLVKYDSLAQEDKIVAIVDSRLLKKSELDRKISVLLKNTPEKPGSEEYEARRRYFEERYLIDWVKNTLFAEEALRKGIQVSDTEVEGKINQLLQSSLGEIDLKDKLKELNSTEAELKSEFRDALLGEKLIYLEIHLRYTEEQLKEIYNTKPDSFRKPPKVRVSQLFKQLKGDEVFSEKNNIKELMDDIRQKVAQNPRKFSSFVKKYSEDTVSKEKDGDIGWQEPVNFLPEPLNKIIFKLKVGGVSDVIESRLGYHILLITDRKEGEGSTFEEAKPIVIDYLYKYLDKTLFDEYKSSHRIVTNLSGIKPQKLNNQINMNEVKK